MVSSVSIATVYDSPTCEQPTAEKLQLYRKTNVQWRWNVCVCVCVWEGGEDGGEREAGGTDSDF